MRKCASKQQLTESNEQAAICKKTMQECVSKQQLTESDEQGAKRKKTMLDRNTRNQQNETEEQAAKRKKTKRDCMRRKHEEMTKSDEQGVKRKKTTLDWNTRNRQNETEEQAAKCKKTKRDCMRKKHEEMRHRSQNDSRDCNGEDITNVIDRVTKKAKQFFYRTRDPANPHKHRATVCGTETIHKLTNEDICAHSERLGVKSYEEYYQTTLKAKVKK